MKNTYNQWELNQQVIKLPIQKSKVDENETQSIQCPMNIENHKYKRGNESKRYFNQYTQTIILNQFKNKMHSFPIRSK